MRIKDLVADDGAGSLTVPSSSSVPITMSRINVDDVFHFLRRNNVKEVEVSFEEMFMVATFVLANTTSPELHNEYGKIFTEGKVDRFLGIKLLHENY